MFIHKIIEGIYLRVAIPLFLFQFHLHRGRFCKEPDQQILYRPIRKRILELVCTRTSIRLHLVQDCTGGKFGDYTYSHTIDHFNCYSCSVDLSDTQLEQYYVTCGNSSVATPIQRPDASPVQMEIPQKLPPMPTPIPLQTAYPAQPAQTLPPMPSAIPHQTSVPPATPFTPEPAQTAYSAQPAQTAYQAQTLWANPIPRNLPNFQVTVKDDDPFANDFNSEGSHTVILAQEKKIK